MIDIHPLMIPISTPSSRILGSDDPLLDEMVSLSERGDLLGAASRAQALWNSGIFDIRTIGFYLCGAFIESELESLPLILQCIEICLGESWEHLEPHEHRKRYGDGALRWLFMTITSQLRFHKRSQKESWRALLQRWEQLPQAQLFASFDRCAAKISDVLHSSAAKDALYGLVAWLKTLPVATAPAASALAAPGDGATSESAESAAKAGGATAAATGSGSEPAAATLTLPISPAMKKLMGKLDAFGRLIALGKFRHAAIVYKDIQTSIGSFDPRQYLPSLFGSYYGHILDHADKITKHMNEDKGFVVDTLKELYQIDLDLFVSSNG